MAPATRTSARKAKMTADAYNDARSPSPAGRSTPSAQAAAAKAAAAAAGSSKAEAKWGGGDLGSQAGLLPGRETLGPIFLMVTTPFFIFVLWYLMRYSDGDMLKFYNTVSTPGFPVFWFQAAAAASAVPPLVPSPLKLVAWKMLLGFAGLELALMKWMPGAEFKAMPTPTGHVPTYTANGMQCYCATLFLVFGAMYRKQVLNPSSSIDPSLVYDEFGSLLAAVSLFAFGFCFALVVKGYNYPSGRDGGKTGSLIVDFYWGTELYPRVLGWDLKTFTNCRFGMMYWAVGICCYAYKQYVATGAVADSMFVSVVLQLVYITKFFWWETGYWCSMDIQHDRAGYYICWGCLVWVPSVYTSQAFYLVNHPVTIGPAATAVNLLLGTLCIWINYDADRQRQHFRKTNGQSLIWGKPAIAIEATYIAAGAQKTSLLLASGWWGLARHFHYLPEVAASVAWTVPFACEGHAIPFFYAFYLTVLLTDRAFRDDVRCASKYGDSWVAYCAKVPYKILPGVI